MALIAIDGCSFIHNMFVVYSVNKHFVQWYIVVSSWNWLNSSSCHSKEIWFIPLGSFNNDGKHVNRSQFCGWFIAGEKDISN